MKSIALLLISLATTVALTGCIIKDPNDFDYDFDKIAAENEKKMDDIMAPIRKSMEQGGQPGIISVSGVVVNDGKTDYRISTVVRGGIGKDGTENPVADSSKPVLSSKNENINISELSEDKSLISLGCDEKVVSLYAKERSLEVQKLPSPITEDVMIISAKTIVLCGKMNEIKYQLLTFNADEMILDQVDYKLQSMLGHLQFNANKIFLSGSSILATKGIDSSMTIIQPASITLNVLKEISSSEDGKLMLMSTGSNYEADKK